MRSVAGVSPCVSRRPDRHRPHSVCATLTPVTDGICFVDRLSDDELGVLRDNGTQRRMATGRVLFHEGDPSTSIYLLERGRVVVVAAADDGHEAIIGWHRPGDLVGELSCLTDGTRSATVRAVSEIDAVEIRGDDFLRLFAEHPPIALAVSAGLAERLVLVDRVLLDGTAPAPVRVARRLLELAVSETNGNGSPAVELRITQDQLAAWAGIARESAAKAIGELRRLDVVSTRRGVITVLDVDVLRRHAVAIGGG